MIVLKDNLAKQVIYETAKKLFLEKGYQVSFRQIAQAIGVSQGLITYHFKTKRNIVMGILKEDYQILANYVKYCIDPLKEPLLFIIGLYYISERIAADNPEKLRFFYDVIPEDIFLECVESSSYRQVYINLIQQMGTNPYEYDAEKNLKLFLINTYSFWQMMVRERYNGFDVSDEDFLEQAVDLLHYSLGRNVDRTETKAQIKLAKERINELLRQHPYLLDLHAYFIKNDFVEKYLVPQEGYGGK